MANPGVGNKFVSVNLNKSYGQPPSSSSNAARTRTTHHGSGGGMVVLSRSRSSVSGIAKSVTRLSVPPPLNLPSLRRENERFDQSSSALSGSSGARNARPGSGNGPPATGWTRPGSGDRPTIGRLGNDWQRVSSPSDSDSRVTAGVYTPPAARSGTVGQQQVAALPHSVPPVEKAVVLKGEDFPTLHATLSSALATAEKQKDSLHQKHKLNEDTLKEQRGSFDSLLPLQMRPQLHSSPLLVGNGSDENGTLSRASDGHNAKEQSRKLDMFLPGSLPVVQLNHTSNWEDDERDTGHGIPKRDSDRLLLRAEVVREREFDTPRVKLPQSFVHDSDGRGIRDVEVSKVSSREVFRVNPYSRDVMVPSRDVRDGSSWKASLSLVKDGIGGREIGVDRNVISARPFTPGRDNKFNEPTYRDSRITPGRDNNFSEPTYRDSGITPGRDNKFNEPTYRDSGIRGFRGTGNGAQDSRYERRDSSYVPSVQNGVHALEGNSRSTDWNPRTCYGDLSNRCNRVDVFQSSTMAKASFSSGSKGLPVNDPILSIGREKRVFSNSGKPYIDDTFDIRDPLSGGLVWDSKMFKRKKDALKQADFRDPVRESFEAELERVQKMQEQERQRVVEEQERALELARREEEERQRLAREEEERRIRLEEEAREAAWSTEQERLGAMKKAEEQKMAREEEKRRVLLEEERRKEAARQKLLALEARIARRKAEATKEDTFTTVAADQTISQMPKGRDGLKVADVGDSQDGETMVEHITNSTSSDCSSLSRSCETGSRPHSSRDVNSVFMDRGKSSSFWNKDVFENGNGSSYLSQQVLEIGSHFSRRDGLESGRVVSRKDFHGGPGLMYSQISSTVGLPESHMDDHAHLRGHRRNVGGDGYDYNRNTEVDTEFLYNQMDKFEDIGWGHSQPRGNPNAPYVERFFQNKEVDGFSPFGSSRHSVRQPRVLPPPSLPSMHRGSFRTESQRSSSSGFMDDELKQRHTIRRDEHIMHDGYESSYQGKKLEQSGTVAADSKNVIHIEQKDDKNPLRCDSQSSLSVSSPPDSPTHLSHDDLDDSRDSRDLSVLSAADNGKRIFLSENECLSATGVNTNVIVDSTSVSLGEDGEWAIENNEELQEQEEYDEEEDGYHEEDEVREGARENLDLAQEFEDLHSEKQNNADEIGQMVLCFNDGVQVGMPGDDEFENPPENGEKAIGMESVSVGIGHSGVVGNEHSLQAESSLSEGNMESSSSMKHETEKSLHDVNIKNSVVSSSSLLHSAGVHSSSCIPDEQAVSLPKDMSPSQQEQTALPTLSSVPSQAEGPVKLQFGLFSGPSLIPSPVPAIQIGSIQMPLLHPPVGHSLSQFHSSQAPFFQFGQLRYTSAISQGILPLVPQTFSLAQPTISAHYSLNQNPGGSLQNQVFQDSSTQVSHLNDMVSSVRMDDQPGSVPKLSDSFQESISKEKNGFFVAKSEELPPQRQVDGVLYVENVIMPESVSPAADQGHHDVTIEKNHRSMAANSETQGQKQKDSISTQVISTKRAFGGSKAPGSVSGNKGKRFVYAVRNTGSTSSTPVSETSHLDSNGFQRRYRRNIRRHEFRVRENVDRRQSEGAVSSNHSRADEKSNFNGKVRGVFVKGGSKKDTLLNKSSEPLVESEIFTTSKSLNLRGVGTDNKMDKTLVKEASSKKLNCTMDGSRSGGRTLLSSAISEDDVDAPLQSGVVRVFKQPGIEAPSDEDDFIEVRSKRQMLNDRREQREKEIKAKSKVIKRVPRKVCSVSQTASISANPNRKATSLHGDNVKGVHSDPVVSDGCASANDEVSAGFANGIASPPLPPIGTPATSTDTQADGRSLTMKSVKTSSPIISSGGTNLAPGSPFVNNNAVLDNVVATFGSWANVGFGQQVIALTQNQLDEAMKPARLDTNVAPIGDNTVAALESEKQSMSILQQDRSFSSAASPLTSLLAGEKIQFGAVTSPTILPPSSLPVSISIGPSGPCQADSSLDHNVPASDGGCTIYFDKDKQPDGSCVQLEDPEAEAEAAASAVAVAAISSDELVGSGMGTSSTSVSVTKSFAGGDIVGFSSAVVADQQFPSQSRGEESLTLALPADLSVETPSLPLWPPLPSPHNSSGPMFSHFPVAPPSHFPCFEMNPMFGGPVFAFGPHDESGSTRPQSQKSSTPATGSLGAWQPCHSDIDSFYGPSGFTGPFISPGGIPRVQGPPHMVVYNHFAPVGQFGQLGLSFMGTTYIPSGKQPDWKHPPTSSATGISEGDINVASGQLNPPNMPAPIRHLAPGSPLLPMASPLAMFELSPFQSSADVSAQACWSCLPTSSHHPAAPSLMPLQQQAEGGIPSQFSHGMTVGTSNMTSFQEPCSMTPSEVGRNVPQVSGSVAQFSNELGLVDPSSARIAHVSTSAQFSNELGLVDPSSARIAHVSTSIPTSYNSSFNGKNKGDSITKSSSRDTAPDASDTSIFGNNSSINGSDHSNTSALKAQHIQQQNSSAAHHLPPIGYTEQRGKVSQEGGSSGGNGHHRSGFQRRNQISGVDKKFAPSKTRQIYVAKPATSVPTTNV